MASGGNEFDPFSTKPSDWGLTGDVLVGESPSSDSGTVRHGTVSVPQMFKLARDNGWSGNMPWADVGMNNYNNIDAGLKCSTANSCPATATLNLIQ